MTQSIRTSFSRKLSARPRRWRRTGFFRPIGEGLEARSLLTGATDDYAEVAPKWFIRLPSGLSTYTGQTFIGPLSIAVGSTDSSWQSGAEVAQWIVRLKPEATEQAGSIYGAEGLLNSESVTFDVLRGLGLPGQMLVEGSGSTDEERAALAGNPNVASFEPNAYVRAQAQPNDPDFPSLTGLNNSGQFGATVDADVDAPEAWDENTGSTNVVVGVIDSGIDYTHPDLYLNIWINQGEIPAALKSQLVDADADGRFSFYDLNDAANAGFVRNFNSNTYIDAGDLFADPGWADGVDTDRNSFVDDLVGWNFRSAVDEPFEPNNPQDVLGHGTHVAGTIGAIGNNGRGVTGLNWRSSLMALKFLDDGNTGQTADAIVSINYATMMRTQYDENVRVINASWGQSGSESPALRDAIEASGQADMLFVAAAGNGNILGQGINLDRDPFFPASSTLDNVISVAASGPSDELARFSNFGLTSVDLAAPGIGVLSTLPGGRYGTSNGTSMAAPHVAGVAALILAELPFATSAEVKQAILSTVDPSAAFNTLITTGGRLNAKKAIDSRVFAPRASLVAAANISAAGGTENLVTVKYRDRQGINDATIGDADLIATRQWGTRDTITATYVTNSKVIANGGTEVTATYRIAAPGGSWDPLDFGRYVLSVVEGQVKNSNGLNVPVDPFGEFSVRVSDPAVIYVNSFLDAVDANVGNGTCTTASGDCTLRAAIQEANKAAPAPRTIILDEGTYKLSVPPVLQSPIEFPLPPATSECMAIGDSFASSNVASGDLDILGQITIIGNLADLTTIDAAGIDRVFKVYPDGRLLVNHASIIGGAAPYGGGILTAGRLELTRATVASNSASSKGGGIAIWDGSTLIDQTTIRENSAQYGGGLFVCNGATVDVLASALVMNAASISGGGLLSSLGGDVQISNSTVSQNTGGALIGTFTGNSSSGSPSISADGRFVAFHSSASNLVPDDTNEAPDVFVLDRESRTIERVSVATDGSQARSDSLYPSISADGRFVTFLSYASSLVSGDTNNNPDIFVFDRQTRIVERVGLIGGSLSDISVDGRFVAFDSVDSTLIPGDTNKYSDVFVFDRETRTIERVSVGANGTQGDQRSSSPSISSDGRFVAFHSLARNLVSGDTNNSVDVFVFDRQTRAIERITVANDGNFQDSVNPSISGDGRFVAFSSRASSLVSGDTNNQEDIFVFDRQTRTTERVSVASNGTQAAGSSSFPHISRDGRFVTFESQASNLVPEDTNSSSDIFVFDRQTRIIEWVSVSANSTQGNFGGGSPAISGDGRLVALASFSSNLVEGDYNERTDVFIYDRQLKQIDAATFIPGRPITLESVTVDENQGVWNVSGAVLSHNSLFVRNMLGPVNVISRGFNIADNTSSSVLKSSDRVVATTGNGLGPLADNGGPTLTHALLSGSPAIDGADQAIYPATDQRGVSRPQDGDGISGSRPDVGAFESFQSGIQGTVFRDQDGDGERDSNESGLAGQTVYIDANKNGRFDLGELAETTAMDDPSTPTILETGTFSFGALLPGTYWTALQLGEVWSRGKGVRIERISETSNGIEGNNESNSFLQSLSEDGRFVAFASVASNLVPGDTNTWSDIFVFDRQNSSMERVSIANDGSQGNFDSDGPSISSDGRFVAFSSEASNLVPGDTNEGADVFVFDRLNRTIERISVTNDGVQGDSVSLLPVISKDGRFVAFTSVASNLAPEEGDGPFAFDVFIYDRQSRTVERAYDSIHTNTYSVATSISNDGRFIAFVSTHSDLVPGDTNGVADAFVYDRNTHGIERVSVRSDGTEGNGDSNIALFSDSSIAAISGDGRYVAFSSDLYNLALDDNNNATDVFLHDRLTKQTARISNSRDGQVANGASSKPSISSDGRFIAFISVASNLVPDDTNDAADIFVYDTHSRTIERVSDGVGGLQLNSDAESPSISQDGRFIAFDSPVSDLVSDDSGSFRDVFVTANPNAIGSGSISVGLFAGQIVSNVDFGLVPNPGEIRGRCFDDVIANGARDEGEPGRASCAVYLDLNSNSRFDPGDASTVSANDGSYVFSNLEAELEYRVGLGVIPSGQSLILPSVMESGVWDLFLPAGGTIVDRDFGLRPASTLGQFENAVIQGRLFMDQPGAVKPGVPGIGLFVDLDDDGVRDFDEPRTISANDNPATPGVDESGQYSFGGLGTRPYTVRVQDVPANLRQKTPIGNSFARIPISLASPTRLLGSPLDVVVADFNSDNWPDLASVIFDGNAVSILMNDGHGEFLTTPIDVSLAPAGRPISQPRGTGPIALVAGNFNGAGGMDLAVANSFSSNVAILLDFNGSGFESETYINVGLVPSGITSGDLESDGDLDLVVTNNLENATGTIKNVSLLRNNGQGVFTAIANPPSAGNNPSAVVVGNFNGDTFLDLAITDFGTNPRGADLGDVRVLLASANGTFQSSNACGIGFGPSALTTADLNGDQKLDLAVANFLSDNVSICLGNGSGGFQSMYTLSGGSGPTDIGAADIDDDDDLDLLITNGKSQKVGILRSRLSQGVFEFEPAESFGAAQFVGVTRLSFAAGDFDRDGDVDLATASSERNELTIQRNVLVGGAQRRALNGVETLMGVDFTFQSLNLPPTLSPIADPPAVNEDSGAFSIGLSGITAGDGENQPLAITLSTNNPSLFASLSASGVQPDGAATVQLTPAPNQLGQGLVTVTVTDGGLDNNLDTPADNRSVERSFNITVNSLNDPPTTTADRYSFARNTGAHTLDVLANDSIAPDVNEQLTLFFVAPPPATVGSLTIQANQLRYTPAPSYLGTFTTQYFVTDGTIPVAVNVTIEVKNPGVWHNSAKPLDVRGGNSVVPDNVVDAGDALAIINYINAFDPEIPEDAEFGLPFGFLDTNNDNKVAPDDALSVINAINSGVDGEGESIMGTSVANDLSENELLLLLATDTAYLPRRNTAR